ncbi:MAG: hypothetical protein UR52_C0002G0101 [Candidatus Gottesmanbacteria bacterium GW2011_GWA1_34_13]|uniref:DUF4900 domain-containing protein n=1 Tax=Candidatus Gottesmanbacteria bacterium GW2011_GWA1_34_13 TaxID=1618434 RepID=A0A0G0AS45_9BACT|nr:MAG: hypothetical protein UR52_C0002G0101 [Candidatus Gottesmanbacteria bacterium GW2011_GWA1_34_13]
MKKNSHWSFKNGSISILVLVFGLVFAFTIGGLALAAATLYTSSQRTESFEKALTIAQAGAEYYRWHLAHSPNDFQDGTLNPGPYIHQINDPYGNTQGTFSLTITPPATGSSIVTVASQGWENSHPEIKRIVKTKYGIPSLAKYSFLHNANVWFGGGITVHGKVMSNGGIRMDGINDSLVQSSKSTYTCGSETGCSPSQIKPGVWGNGGPSNLWNFPVPPADFNSLIVDFSDLKIQAQQTGIYLGPSGGYGYHLIFNSDGTITIRRITQALNRKGWSVENGCENLYQQINTEINVGTYPLDAKPIVFAEDHLWVDGVVNGVITVVAAKFPTDINNMNIWINNNLTYIAKDGHSRLGLFAQNNIYFGLGVPNNFEVNGALLAQKGRIIRHNYRYSFCSSYSNAVRNNFTFYGSLISNQKSYWNFGTGPTSGFITRDFTYDPSQYYDPPPFFPTQGEYEFISWEEQ